MQNWPLLIMQAFDECVKTGTIGNDAHDATTGELVPICDRGETEKLMCVAFVAGVVHGFAAAEEHIRIVTLANEAIPKMICPPSTWTASEGFRIFMSWAKGHRELWHAQPGSGVLLAHLDAYPCD